MHRGAPLATKFAVAFALYDADADGFIGRGDVEGVKRLLGAGYKVDVRDATGLTPLHWAVTNYRIAALKVLLGGVTMVTHASVACSNHLHQY